MARTQEGRPIARFYQVAASSIEGVMIVLLHKLVEQGRRVCLVAGDARQVRHLDDLLWRQPPDRFLPHGVWNGADVERQPVLIAERPDDRNGATVAMAVVGGLVDGSIEFDVVVDFVDAQAPAAARERYRYYQGRDFAMEYWFCSPEGKWIRKG
ncbi:MAG: DNA polymerase III subunit chi [Magnetococcales bacterium]|nr:DNA polymerase III subunit chi [Magnetococcales bacterium]